MRCQICNSDKGDILVDPRDGASICYHCNTIIYDVAMDFELIDELDEIDLSPLALHPMDKKETPNDGE